MRGRLTEAECEAGWVLACSSRVSNDATMEIPQQQPDEVRILGSDRVGISAESDAESLAVKQFLDVGSPTLDNSFADLDRLQRRLSQLPLPPLSAECSVEQPPAPAASLPCDLTF